MGANGLMDGLLIVDKPQGISSHDVVARGRRAVGTRAIGHAGTLDPMATGVLVLCINKATRLSEYLLGEDKSYTGVIRLGQRTNTDDAEGEILEERPVTDEAISDEMLAKMIVQFSGPIMQVPPQFSAIKRDGQRAYALARKGETVALESRPVTIHHIALTRLSNRLELQIDVTCSSGTYIRSLARDIGELLGCGGHLSALRRTKAGTFDIAQALPLERLAEWREHLLPMDLAVAHFPAVHLDELGTRAMTQGRFLTDVNVSQEGLCRVYDAQGSFLAIGQVTAQVLKPVKVFA